MCFRPLAVQGKLIIDCQGVEICLKRPWRRETMHNLVKEATGIDFTQFGSDLKKAKDVTLSSLNMGSNNQEANSIRACQSTGHVLNEEELQLVLFKTNKNESLFADQDLALDLSLSALLGKNIYNFGELLAHQSWWQLTAV